MKNPEGFDGLIHDHANPSSTVNPAVRAAFRKGYVVVTAGGGDTLDDTSPIA